MGQQIYHGPASAYGGNPQLFLVLCHVKLGGVGQAREGRRQEVGFDVIVKPRDEDVGVGVDAASQKLRQICQGFVEDATVVATVKVPPWARHLLRGRCWGWWGSGWR